MVSPTLFGTLSAKLRPANVTRAQNFPLALFHVVQNAQRKIALSKFERSRHKRIKELDHFFVIHKRAILGYLWIDKFVNSFAPFFYAS